MIDYSFGYEMSDGHHGLGASEAAPPVAFTVRRHDSENPLACEEIVYRPERTCENLLDDHCCDFECSECGFSVRTVPGEGTDWHTPFWSYCPNCGAKVAV